MGVSGTGVPEVSETGYATPNRSAAGVQEFRRLSPKYPCEDFVTPAVERAFQPATPTFLSALRAISHPLHPPFGCGSAPLRGGQFWPRVRFGGLSRAPPGLPCSAPSLWLRLRRSVGQPLQAAASFLASHAARRQRVRSAPDRLGKFPPNTISGHRAAQVPNGDNPSAWIRYAVASAFPVTNLAGLPLRPLSECPVVQALTAPRPSILSEARIGTAAIDKWLLATPAKGRLKRVSGSPGISSAVPQSKRIKADEK